MVQQQVTDAEKMLLEGWATHADSPEIMAVRHEAMTAFAAQGLPSRRLENWHYTDLRVLLRDIPESKTHENKTHAGQDETFLQPLVADSHILGLLNGRAQSNNSLACAVSLGEQLMAGNRHALPQWRIGDVISQINTAYVRDGWRLDIASTHDPKRVIEIQHQLHGGQSHVFLPISVAAAARATIILRETGDKTPALTTTRTDLDVEEGADVVFVLLRQIGGHASSLNQFNACLAQGAKLTLFVVNAGVSLLRQEINVTLDGKGADFQLRGVNLLDGKTHADITMDVRHQCENTSSTEILRNVVTDNARGVFQGMIRVARQAQKTDARMACNSLILSDHAEFNAKPELEIFADDVACGHGATVVEINREHLFYLMARGIPKYQARAMLIEAFVAQLAEELENEEITQAIKAMIGQWLSDRVAQRSQAG